MQEPARSARDVASKGKDGDGAKSQGLMCSSARPRRSHQKLSHLLTKWICDDLRSWSFSWASKGSELRVCVVSWLLAVVSNMARLISRPNRRWQIWGMVRFWLMHRKKYMDLVGCICMFFFKNLSLSPGLTCCCVC